MIALLQVIAVNKFRTCRTLIEWWKLLQLICDNFQFGKLSDLKRNLGGVSHENLLGENGKRSWSWIRRENEYKVG